MNRYLFVFIFCCVGGFSHAQFSIQWNAGVDVAPSSFGNEHPRIAVDANGNPLDDSSCSIFGPFSLLFSNIC
ncbi:MAG TPA: hypothetical protein PLU53_11935, partial [Bacteroidia bacterium]|nr:hypothetical protein [Bacteroidia bacterium]